MHSVHILSRLDIKMSSRHDCRENGVKYILLFSNPPRRPDNTEAIDLTKGFRTMTLAKFRPSATAAATNGIITEDLPVLVSLETRK
jgi:hypothetical protein